MEDTTGLALCQALVQKKLLTMEVLERCLQQSSNEAKSLEDILVEQKLVGKDDIVRAKNFMIAGRDVDIPGYLLIKKVGEGGMGEVYKGIQLSLDRTVAIKFLDPELGKNQNFLQRFIQEARGLAQLNHRNIVKGIDFCECRGTYYYVMEYLSGRNIQDIVDKKGPLKEKTALAILMQMSQALEYIESQQLIHRDVKPENILLCKDGTAKLCDLGLAKWQKCDLALTREGAIVGTPYYLSPEQAQGKIDVDIRSDIYSLGATLHFMMTGKPPYEGEKATVIHFRHIYDPPPKVTEVRADLSSQWDKFFARIMAKDIEKRIQSPKELMQAVAKLARNQSAPVPKKSPGEPRQEEPSNADAPAPETDGRNDSAKKTRSLPKPVKKKSTRNLSRMSPASRQGKSHAPQHSTKSKSIRNKLILALLLALILAGALVLGIGLRLWTK